MLARIRKSIEEKEEGFTLIELLVVIIIIGILAAIAIPVFLNQRKKAVDASMKSDARTVATEMETYFTDNQTYPAIALSSAPQVGTGGTTVKLTTGNQATVTQLTTGTNVDGFCVKISRLSTAQPGTGDWYYSSKGGGLLGAGATC